ncbi:hypothetical protein [Halobiforma nitratireducens]|uniref:Uncharacterized protein n=1 Tax=Halobiforma nitratireducens JCM 10879 TaxID=1227454 RepID=M0LH19_9EURY|nr:hypothetical protein [Halobiforma nitratireducens]EMA32378.1 hypothetical protein C446_14739 [Halobiforma nitratireducens JCM 10879]
MTDSDRGRPFDAEPAPDDDVELEDAEEQALHEMQLGIEYIYRAYGCLLEFHHHVGRGMNRMSDAEAKLREAGHEEWADRLHDDHLPAGAIGDRWTFELVDEFAAEFLDEIDDLEGSIRDDLADGVPHVTERRHKRQLRERADWGRAGERGADDTATDHEVETDGTATDREDEADDGPE